MRSSAKPFQAMTFVETGAAGSFSVTAPELAVIAASHSGEPRHTETVASVLARAGLNADALLCGTHPPLHTPTRRALERNGETPGPLYHNCSGKHCGMLCACVHEGWDQRTYLRPDHPFQGQVLHLVSDVCGVPDRNIEIATDGCGVPTFGVPLRAFAHAFARLARPDQMPSEHCASACAVRDAMTANPGMVAGEGRFDTRLMEAAPGRLLSKGGAEACQAMAVLDRGWGIALKIEDGGARAIAVAALEVLRQLDALSESERNTLAELARPVVRNYRDEIVGEGRPLFSLERP